MKLRMCTNTPSVVPRATKWLAAGILIGVCIIPTQAFAACSGSAGIANDGTDLDGNGLPDYLESELPATINWTLTPAAGSGSLDIDVDTVRFALTCANNGDAVPCTNGNDAIPGTPPQPTPLQFGSLTGGDCGASVASISDGVVTFDLPEFTLDEDGCTIEFSTQLINYGTDTRGDLVTPAVAFEGQCAGGLEDGSAAGSDTVQILDPEIEVTKMGPELAKVGDEITYTISFTVLSNPEILGECTLYDELLGGDLGVVVPDTDYFFDYPIPSDATGPIENTAEVTCEVTGTASTVVDDDSWEVPLIDPEVVVDKTGPDTSKAGDEITYTISFTTSGFGDNLGECTLYDELLGGDLGVVVPDQEYDFNYPIPSDAVGPVLNTAIVTCDVLDFDNDAEGQDGHDVDLIVPSIEVSKIGPEIAKVGDEITYTISFTNTGTGTLGECTLYDELLGGALGVVVPGQDYDFNYPIPADATGPIDNTAEVTCAVVGFDNEAIDDADWSVDLIDPSIEVSKIGPEIAKAGDEITYTISFTNTGTGTLGECTLYDELLGGDLGVVVPGQDYDFNYPIPSDASGSVDNTAEVTCAVEGFDNEAIDDADWSVDVINPSVDLSKECRPDPVTVGGTIEWAITVTNDGDTAIDCTVDDPTAGINETVMLEPGDSQTYNADREVLEGDGDSISNTATVDCDIEGFDNGVEDEATADCEVERPAELCRTPGFWKVRAGDEKGGRNITGEVIASTVEPGLMVCGEYMTDSVDAMEAMCISVQSETKRQLVRQLTAGMLNCTLGICTTEHTQMLENCNAACVAEDDTMYNACIDEIDCFNNGGIWDGAMCIYGTGECAVTGEACSDVEPCPMVDDLPQECVPDPTCHDDGNLCEEGAEFCFEPVGRNSSPKECKQLESNDTYWPYPNG